MMHLLITLLWVWALLAAGATMAWLWSNDFERWDAEPDARAPWNIRLLVFCLWPAFMGASAVALYLREWRDAWDFLREPAYVIFLGRTVAAELPHDLTPGDDLDG